MARTPRPFIPRKPPRAAPALAAKADDLEALRTALVDASTVSGGLWLSYLFALFYLLVAAGGVTHKDLLLENPVKLPFLNVDLPLQGFFWLGPAIFVVLHAYVLLHFVMLADKTIAFGAQLSTQITDLDTRTRLRRQLPSSIFVQLLAGPRDFRRGVHGAALWIIASISLVIGPIALLLFFLLQFLPYHHEVITWWQRIAIVLDFVLLLQFWPKILQRLPPEWLRPRPRRIPPGAVAKYAPLVFVAALLIILPGATFPGEWLNDVLQRVRPYVPLRKSLISGEIDFATRRPRSLFSDILVVPGVDVIDHAKIDEAKLKDLRETISLRGRNLRGAVLSGAVLRKADFTASDLRGAQLDQADLRGARFDCAREPRSFDILHLTPDLPPEQCAQMQAASISGAQLQGASLDGALLSGANLQVANLQGANLFGASLQGASLQGAQLQASVLHGAVLQAASLRAAKLQGLFIASAHFDGADLQQAVLVGASLSVSLQAAILDQAELQGATLNGSHLDGASLVGTFVWRSDARDADGVGMTVTDLHHEPLTRASARLSM